MLQTYERGVPFGYKKNEEGVLELIPEQLEALEKAKWYIAKGSSLAKVRHWLVNKTKREISIPGMLKIIKYDKSSRQTT